MFKIGDDLTTEDLKDDVLNERRNGLNSTSFPSSFSIFWSSTFWKSSFYEYIPQVFNDTWRSEGLIKTSMFPCVFGSPRPTTEIMFSFRSQAFSRAAKTPKNALDLDSFDLWLVECLNWSHAVIQWCCELVCTHLFHYDYVSLMRLEVRMNSILLFVSLSRLNNTFFINNYQHFPFCVFLFIFFACCFFLIFAHASHCHLIKPNSIVIRVWNYLF